MTEVKETTDTSKGSPEELTPDAITTNPEKTLKELKSLRAENAKKNDLIKGLEEKYNGINGKLSDIEATAKAENDEKLLADGKIQELLDSTKTDNEILKSQIKELKEKNTTFETAEKIRLDAENAKKTVLIEAITIINPTVAATLNDSMTLEQLTAFKGLLTNKPQDVGAARPNNGMGGDGKPDLSKMSPRERRHYLINLRE